MTERRQRGEVEKTAQLARKAQAMLRDLMEKRAAKEADDGMKRKLVEAETGARNAEKVADEAEKRAEEYRAVLRNHQGLLSEDVKPTVRK